MNIIFHVYAAMGNNLVGTISYEEFRALNYQIDEQVCKIAYAFALHADKYPQYITTRLMMRYIHYLRIWFDACTQNRHRDVRCLSREIWRRRDILGINKDLRECAVQGCKHQMLLHDCNSLITMQALTKQRSRAKIIQKGRLLFQEERKMRSFNSHDLYKELQTIEILIERQCSCCMPNHTHISRNII